MAADIWGVTDDLSAQVTEGYRSTRSLLDGDIDVAEQLWQSAAVLKLPRTADFVGGRG
ncbi:MAG: hypothetical protein WCG47_25340 [Dermatophilaceae bacterium]